MKINEWEKELPVEKFNKTDINFDDLYEHAHSELSLQQSKRDQIITIYLAICSFLIPFALGEELIDWNIKGWIFLAAAVVGFLFSGAVIRYREYKEVYWLTCRVIPLLKNYASSPENKISKTIIQQTFYYCIKKKGKKYKCSRGNKTSASFWKYAWGNKFSAETFHFIVIALITSIIAGVGVGIVSFFNFDFNSDVRWISILTAILVGVAVLLFLLYYYFNSCSRIYKSVLYDEVNTNDNDDKNDIKANKRKKAFNKAFGKAMFLHFYVDESEENIKSANNQE